MPCSSTRQRDFGPWDGDFDSFDDDDDTVVLITFGRKVFQAPGVVAHRYALPRAGAWPSFMAS